MSGEWQQRGVVPLFLGMCRSATALFMACGGVSWGVCVWVVSLGAVPSYHSKNEV